MKQTVQYKTNQSLSYAECGDPKGFPILIQHGMIASITELQALAYELFFSNLSREALQSVQNCFDHLPVLPNCQLDVRGTGEHFSKQALDNFIRTVILPYFK